MKRKVGTPKSAKGRGHKAIQVRIETYEMLTEYQEKVKQNRGYKVTRSDLMHIAIKRLVADDPI